MESLLAQLEILREMSQRCAILTNNDIAYDISVKVRVAEQSVQRIINGKGVLPRLGNLFIRFGWWIASAGNR